MPHQVFRRFKTSFYSIQNTMSQSKIHWDILTATPRKPAYSAIMTKPIGFVILHLNAMMERMTAMSITKSIPIWQAMPAEDTGTLGAMLKRLKRSQGSGNPTVTSKRLEPMEEETAMSPWPARATITEVIKSGTLVPAARKVMPIVLCDNPETVHTMVAHQTMQ